MSLDRPLNLAPELPRERTAMSIGITAANESRRAQQQEPGDLSLNRSAPSSEPPSPQSLERQSGTRKPQQAEDPDDDNLADNRNTVDEEGNESANNGCFDQM